MIDRGRRPATYWPEPAGDPESTPPTAARDERLALGDSHPAFLGGVFLPDPHPEEVEIVRVDLQSTTADAIRVLACRDGDAIAFRVVDEYETEFVLPIARSVLPLTVGEADDLLMNAEPVGDPDHRGITQSWREFNLTAPGDAHDLIDFVQVTSRFYPELADIDRERALAWAWRISPDR